MPSTDILLVSIGSTGGWRSAALELAESMRRVGPSVAIAQAPPWPTVRTFAATDFVQARAARAAARQGIAEHSPRAIVYCSITSALLWPRPGAIYLDSIAAENRPGRHGIWQRPIEGRRLRESPLLLPWSERALPSLPAGAVVLPPPVQDVMPQDDERDVAAATYAADPSKRRLDLVLAAWSAARREGETLVVTGLPAPPRSVTGVEWAGMVAPEDFRALLARTRVFVAAPSREDFGIAALEALAAGCVLVTTPSAGPYPALALARQLDARFVTDDLPRAIRIALDDPRPGYALRAAELLAPFRRSALDRTVAERVLPRLLPA